MDAAYEEHLTNTVLASRFYGKYRGKVLSNIEPLFQGRLVAEVPAISGSMMNFALPCVPYETPHSAAMVTAEISAIPRRACRSLMT